MNNYEANGNDSALGQEVVLQQNRLFSFVSRLIVLGGAGLYIEGAFNDAPKDSLAGLAAIGVVATVVYSRHRRQTPQNVRNS